MAHFLMAFDEIDKNGTGVISFDDVRKYTRRENFNENFSQVWITSLICLV